MSEHNSSLSYVKADSKSNYSVGVVDNIILKDERRDRELPVKIYYPQNEGSFPVIIFSHGIGGSKESFSYLSNFWASHGYICIHPTHPGTDLSALQKMGLQALIESTNDPQIWQERPQDISFIINSFEELQQQIPQLKGKIQSSLVGVSGHSYGAYTTVLLAGAVVSTPWNQEVTFRDERVKVFLAISPQGTNRMGLTKQSWAKIHVPAMTISGSKDQGLEGKAPSWRLEAFNYMPPVDKYHVLVEGAHHFSFDPDVGIGKTFEQIFAKGNKTPIGRNRWQLEKKNSIKIYLQNASLAFWDAYLNAENSAKEYLKSEALQTYSNGEVTIFRK